MKINWRCSICNKILHIKVEGGYLVVPKTCKVANNGDLICQDCIQKMRNR